MTQEQPDRGGHDEVAHAHLGFCAQCDGYSWAAEAIGWRTYAKQGALGRWLYRLSRLKGARST
ncbi:MAG TPA: hypothetical protein VEL76_05250 [Gemmataceae bacterium]|nr:hypothetical protein [Gemmataceae bacterium]